MHRSKLSSLIIDCRTDDLEAAAKFWSQALGRPYQSDGDGKYMHLETAADVPVVMEAPTGQRFCVVRPQRGEMGPNANKWD
jgi:hypothetical protein